MTIVLFRMTVRVSNYETPGTHEANDSHLLKVKSCTASLRVLQLYISIYRKSILRYKCLILDTGHPDCLHVRQQGFEVPWRFFEAKRGPRTRKFVQHYTRQMLVQNHKWFLPYPIKFIPHSELCKLCS